MKVPLCTNCKEVAKIMLPEVPKAKLQRTLNAHHIQVIKRLKNVLKPQIPLLIIFSHYFYH